MLREMGVPPFWPILPTEPTVPTVPTEAADLPSAGAAPAAETPPSARPVQPAVSPAEGGAGRPPVGQPPGRASASVASPARAPVRPPVRDEASPVTAPTPPEQALGPRPVGVETMDWPALRETVAGCRACSLCDSRKQTVFGTGHSQARWMLVGEAPGEQEDREGEPFVGRAGQLLDRMLAAIELTRSEDAPERQVFIANVLKCRPPANRNPLPQEVAQCEPYLLRQMALVQPDLIVAMGRFAVQSLLKTSEPIGKLRGRVHEVAGIPVVVTYHPAYLLRNPADKALVWDDLCLARELQARRAAAR